MRVYKIFTDAGPVNEWYTNSWDRRWSNNESHGEVFLSLYDAEQCIESGPDVFMWVLTNGL